MKRGIRNSRKGTVLITVLVCLGFTTSILLGCVHMSLTTRRGLRQHQQMNQTHWLLEAGIQRGLQNFKLNQSYEGERITLSQPLSNLDSAVVEIKILPATEIDKAQRMTVVATIQKNKSTPETTTVRSITLQVYH